MGGGHNFKLCGRGRCPRGADPEVTAPTTGGNSVRAGKRGAKLLAVWGWAVLRGLGPPSGKAIGWIWR